MTTDIPGLDSSARFHHIALACKNLESDLSILSSLGYAVAGDEFVDPIQGVRGLFLEGLGPRIELLEALPGRDVLDPWLRGPARIYQIAYEVADMEQTIEAMSGFGARLIVEPVPAVAFDQRRICFLMLRNMLLVELIESPDRPADASPAPG